MLVVCEKWVGDWDRLQHIDPKFFWHSSTSFAFWLGCSTVGHWGPKLSVWSWFSLRGHPISNCDWNWTDLTQAVCGTWLYNCLTPTCFLWAYAPDSTTSTGHGEIPISSTGCTCFAVLRLFTQVHLLIDSSVEGQCYRKLVAALKVARSFKMLKQHSLVQEDQYSAAPFKELKEEFIVTWIREALQYRDLRDPKVTAAGLEIHTGKK